MRINDYDINKNVLLHSINQISCSITTVGLLVLFTVLQTRGNALFLIIILGIGGSFQSGYHITGLSSPSPVRDITYNLFLLYKLHLSISLSSYTKFRNSTQTHPSEFHLQSLNDSRESLLSLFSVFISYKVNRVQAIKSSPLNLSLQYIKRFINSSWYDRYEEPPPEATVTIIWSLIVSMYAVGGLFGAVSVKFISDMLGR